MTLLTYEHRAERPYAHEVRTLAGRLVTALGPADHPWHAGISLVVAHVAGYNFWGGPTYVDGQGYLPLDDHGTIRHERWLAGGDHELSWISPGGRRLLAETRRLGTAVTSATTWRLSWSFDLVNVSGAAIEIGSPATHGRAGAGYGGLFWRGADEFRGGEVRTADRVGEDEVNGRPAPWVAFHGPRASLVFWADEAVAEPWFVRSAEYPGVCAALAFQHPITLAAGATLSRTYRVDITDRDP
jgi:methane monooxygenase PmoA-like